MFRRYKDRFGKRGGLLTCVESSFPRAPGQSFARLPDRDVPFDSGHSDGARNLGKRPPRVVFDATRAGLGTFDAGGMVAVDESVRPTVQPRTGRSITQGRMKALVRRWAMAARAPRQIREYLSTVEEPRLHLGCGGELLDGWLNADVNGAVFLDLTQRFPIPNESMAYIYHEHVIEHLLLGDARHMLNECFRVLRRKGVMRVSCPDFQLFARHYLDSPAYFFESPIFKEAGYAQYETALQRLCHLLYGFGHRWMWDFESLNRVLASVGFDDIERREFRASPHAVLRHLDRERRRSQSMYVEARKP